MSSAKYYKHEADSDYGVGIVYMEIVNEYAVRQVEIYDGKLFWADENETSDASIMLSDQPNSVMELGPEDEISKDEFEKAWSQARSGRQATSEA